MLHATDASPDEDGNPVPCTACDLLEQKRSSVRERGPRRRRNRRSAVKKEEEGGGNTVKMSAGTDNTNTPKADIDNTNNNEINTATNTTTATTTTTTTTATSTEGDVTPSTVNGDSRGAGSRTGADMEFDDDDDYDEVWPMEEPPDTLELGSSTWTLLHTMAAYYPDAPSVERKEHMRRFLDELSHVYPCSYCADDLKGILKRSPPRLQNQTAFSRWMCEAHNDVNQQLGKPQFDCDLVDERWRVKGLDL